MLVPVIPGARKKEETVSFHLSERPCNVFFWPVFEHINTQNKINKFSFKRKKRKKNESQAQEKAVGTNHPSWREKASSVRQQRDFLFSKVSKGSKVGSMPGDQAPCTRDQVGGYWVRKQSQYSKLPWVWSPGVWACPQLQGRRATPATVGSPFFILLSLKREEGTARRHSNIVSSLQHLLFSKTAA